MLIKCTECLPGAAQAARSVYQAQTPGTPQPQEFLHSPQLPPHGRGAGMLHPTNSRWELREFPAVLQWTLSPPQDPSGASPGASYPPALCSLLCLLTNFPARGVTGVTCQIPPWCLSSGGCSREPEGRRGRAGGGSSWNTLLPVRTSKTGHRREREREREGKKLSVQEVERRGEGRREEGTLQ